MAVVGAVQVTVVGWIVATSGFQQDDYLFFWFGHAQGLSVNGVTQSVFGSFIPGFSFVNTVIASTLPVTRWSIVVLTLLMYALLIFVFYRLLELLFGARPVVVVLTSVATCSGLLGVSLVWWTPAVNGLPALIADIVALDGLIRHGLTGRTRYLVVSVVAFGLGTLFYDPSLEIVVPLVLVTLLYFSDLRDRTSVWTALRSRAWLWAGYLVPFVVNFGWRALHPGKYVEPKVGSVPQIIGFLAGGFAKGFTSSALGENYFTVGHSAWRWGIIVLGQLVVVGVVVVTIAVNRAAWRAWVLFFASFLAADLVAAVGRSSQAYYFQLNSLYWCYFIFLFVVAFGLSVLPSTMARTGRPLAPAVEGHDRPDRPDRPARTGVVAGSLVVAVVLCVLGIHYTWTTPDHALGARNRVFTQRLETAWTRIAHDHRPVFLWDTTVPPFVLNPLFRPYNKVSETMGLVLSGLHIGTGVGQGYVVTPQGSLVPASARVIATQAASSAAPGVPDRTACIVGGAGAHPVHILFDRVLPRGSWFVRIAYDGSRGQQLTVGDLGSPYLAKGSGAVLLHLPVAHPVRVLLLTTRGPSHVCESATVETPVADPAG
jgi:hypothetical protein